MKKYKPYNSRIKNSSEFGIEQNRKLYNIKDILKWWGRIGREREKGRKGGGKKRKFRDIKENRNFKEEKKVKEKPINSILNLMDIENPPKKTSLS